MRYTIDTDGDNIKETLVFNGKEYVVNTPYCEDVVDYGISSNDFTSLLKNDLYDDEDMLRMITESLDNMDCIWPIFSSLADIAGAYENKLRVNSQS